MSKHWNPGPAGWLSDAQYCALSPKDRRALHFKRSVTGNDRALRRTPVRFRKRHHARRRLAWTVAAAAFAIFALQYGFAAPHLSGPVAVSVAASAPVTAHFSNCTWGGGTNCVVDGDTFWIGGEKVRIAGIDAPETHDYACASELALGNRASEKLHALLNSGAVTMTPIDRDRDVYGRLLRDVAVDGADVGEAMVSAGVAREYGSGRRTWC